MVTERNRDEEIETIVLAAMYEASEQNFYAVKAMKTLLLRSEIDKRAKQLEDVSPEQKEKLRKISFQLLEAERLLGEMINTDKHPTDYIPVTKRIK